MSEASSLLGIFVIGVAASIVGAMVGGGSLLTIPFLIFFGLPPQVAIATDRFAGLGAAVTAFYRFNAAGKIAWPLVPLLSLASLAGSLIGAGALVNAAPDILTPVVGLLLLMLLPALFLTPRTGLDSRAVSRRRKRVGLALYFLIQILAGFFGAGTGTLIFYTLMGCFGVTIIQAAATQVIPFFVLSLASLVVFVAHGIIDYSIGFVLMAGAAVGGYLGAHIAIRSGEVWVRRLFALVVVISGLRLLFFAR